MRAGDRILHIFSSNGEHDWHEGEVVAAPTTAVRRACVRKTTASIGCGLRRTNWARQIGAVDQVAVLSVPVSRRVALAGSDKAKWEEAITTSTRQWRTMARG